MRIASESKIWSQYPKILNTDINNIWPADTFNLTREAQNVVDLAFFFSKLELDIGLELCTP